MSNRADRTGEGAVEANAKVPVRFMASSCGVSVFTDDPYPAHRGPHSLGVSPSQARAATTSAVVPVPRVGWITGAKFAEWLTGMSSDTRPAASARWYASGSMPPMPQYV